MSTTDNTTPEGTTPVALVAKKKKPALRIVAFGNNTCAVIVWQTDAPIDGCLGFSIRRIDEEAGTTEPLKAYLPFKGQGGEGWTGSTTDKWPVQGFKWKDFGGVEGKTYKYQVVPMVGTPDDLKPLDSMAVVSSAVARTTTVSENIKVCFNRGILSTQKLAHMLPKLPDGNPDPATLIEALKDPSSAIRKMLAGSLPAFIKSIFLEAKAEGGQVFSALYELADPEIVDFLLANPDTFELILGNAGEDDETNKDARARLHAAVAKVIDRFLPKGRSLPHNKFHVRKNKKGKPVAVLSASANATFTGLCCQSNNAISIVNDELAAIYVAYWDALKADTESGEEQGETFRAFNRKKRKEIVVDGARVTAWFSPNTKERTKPSKSPGVPVDMFEVFDAIDAAQEGVYFLAFYPGFPSIISKINGMQNAPSSKKKHLFYRGAVSSPQALPRPFTPSASRFLDTGSGQLTAQETVGVTAGGIVVPDISSGLITPAAAPVQIFHHDRRRPVIIAADSLETAVGNWQRELLKLPEAHSIIHDKLVVIDPFGDEPIVILGSHNLGFKASYANDENLLIIRGNHRLAAACLAHVLDVYDHYRFRSMVRADGGKFDASLNGTPAWQDRFFTPKYLSSKSRRELTYFIDGAKRLEKNAAA
ncbi:MAG: hypothetical protein K2X93_11535 [Candidatus Obscuribacterales bacterium]|nr:hypothetical protein [Candidatus Obscuribacterales bacterium]